MDLINKSFNSLKNYCETQNFKGWDPYDGLNSKVFNAIPFIKKLPLARECWIQFFKRSPINLRKLFLIPKGYNPKAIALFLTGYCNLYNIASSGNNNFGTKEDNILKINELANLLISIKSNGYSGACWGYNFNWQARGDLFFPAGTPNIVVTSFAVSALFKAYEITKNKTYKDIAISSANFILNDLNRSYKKDKSFLFSYSTLHGNNTVYNASLMGSKTLANIFYYTKDENLLKVARDSIRACCSAQKEDGSWVYGELKIQSWIDSFHTGYNLEAIYEYQRYSGDSSFSPNIDKGFIFYISSFFKEDGMPKYYNNKTYPIDIHSPSQLIVTLCRLNRIKENKELAKKVILWTIKNMQSKKGSFYYQLKKYSKSKISYMRWNNAFMFYAFSYYLKNQKQK